MRSLVISGLLCVCFAAVCMPAAANDPQPARAPAKPNIVYILADDLGYGDLGVYGSTKIETPNIDALARSGMVFTQHYSGSPVCAPARYMLLTGKHAGHAWLRGNDEWRDRSSPSGGDVWNFADMEKDPALEGRYSLPALKIVLDRLAGPCKWPIAASTGRH